MRSTSGRLPAPAALLLVLLLLVGRVSPAHAVEPELLRGPYLQSLSENAVTLRWRTDRFAESRVRYGTHLSDLSQVFLDPERVREHEVRLSGLSPDTRYYYAIGSAEADLAGGDGAHNFRTHPPRGVPAPVRIWVVGDSGQCSSTTQGCIDAAAVRDAYLDFVGGQRADVWLLLGDIAYNRGRDSDFQVAFFDMFPTILRRIAPWPVIGNHDLGWHNSVYLEVFSLPRAAEAGGMPTGTEHYYSFDYGTVHFVALDSHMSDRSPEGPMYAWLEADLAASDADWTIVYWHHPPYSRGSHDSNIDLQLIEMRENFLPLLEAHGVDLQLSGHSHSYERSVLLDGHYGHSSTYDPEVHAVDAGDGDAGGDGAYRKPTFTGGGHEGAVYGVVGSSSKLSPGPLDHPVMEVSLLDLGSMVIDVDGSVLEAWFVDDTGSMRDRFRIEKGSPAACNNGLDDDGDGRIDYAEDLGCSGLGDESERIYQGDFQGAQAGDDPSGWVDTASHYSLVPDDTFAVVNAGGGERSFGATSGSHVHSHWVGPGAHVLTSFEMTGRMRRDRDTSGIGVTLLSGYPNADRYYRLQSWGNNSFRLIDRNASINGGITDTGVEPQAGTWYRFRVQVDAEGARTELRARVWPDGTPEPGTWQADAWDEGGDRLTAGTFGAWGHHSGLKEWDDLVVDAVGNRLPRCNDDIDNDGDGLVDWDGGGVGDPDPRCGAPWIDNEAGSCGVGSELAPVLLLLLWLRRHRRSRA